MIPTLALCIASLAVSLAGNALLLSRLKQDKRKKTESIELQDFLMDLRTGWAVLSVKRIDPNDIIIRSPRRT
jgi:hypothetical protein